jgi:hypothetical protein
MNKIFDLWNIYTKQICDFNKTLMAQWVRDSEDYKIKLSVWESRKAEIIAPYNNECANYEELPLQVQENTPFPPYPEDMISHFESMPAPLVPLEDLLVKRSFESFLDWGVAEGENYEP